TGVPASAIANFSPGMSVQGFNIPFGATILSTNAGAGTITLSANASFTTPVLMAIGAGSLLTLGSIARGGLHKATATTTGVTLTVTNRSYVGLPTTDNGAFANNFFGQNTVVMELVSNAPHGLRTGDVMFLYGDVSVPMTNVVTTTTTNQIGSSMTGSITSG